MARYSCKICQKDFTQKSHYEIHKKGKNLCNKDNIFEVIQTNVQPKVYNILSKQNDTIIKNDTDTTHIIQISEMNCESQIDYSKKTLKELIKICKEKGIKGYSNKKKEYVIKILENEKPDDLADTSDINVTNVSKFPLPQYLGSKTKYIEHILKYIPQGVESILDAFSGSGVVSYAFKANNYRVVSNDILSYNAIITKALIENQNIKLNDSDVEMLLSDNPSRDNFIEREFADLYYTREECIFLDNLYSNIIKLDDQYKKALAFASIGRTLIRKILFAYFCHTKAIEYRNDKKHWKRNPAINSPIQELYQKYIVEYNNAVINNYQENLSYNTDILSTANAFDVDLVYFDPPYGGTHADYASYYHFLETYVNYWKDEPLFNTTKQPKNKLTKSKFATKDVVLAFEELFDKFKNIEYWMISYNSNANPKKEKFIELIHKYKKNIDIKEINLQSNNGGMGLRKDSKEYLFICY